MAIVSWMVRWRPKMSAAWAQKGRKVAAVRLKTDMIQFCSETWSNMWVMFSYIYSEVGDGKGEYFYFYGLPNFSAMVGNAAATMVVSNACNVNGANKPSTIFHRYERRRCLSAFSSGVSTTVVGVVDDGDTFTPPV